MAQVPADPARRLFLLGDDLVSAQSFNSKLTPIPGEDVKAPKGSLGGLAMRRVVFSLIGIMVVLLLPAMPSFAQERAVTRQDTARPATISERRLALLIGNSAYTHGGNLRNPVNDVRDMKAALEELGFRVIKHENCTQRP
jgi:hypothetical protein